MQIGLIRKGLVYSIIVLFIGMSFGSSTGKIDDAISTTTIYDGSLLGYVNVTSGNPIEGALVRVYFHETYEEDYSDSSGFYHIINIPICYCLKNATCYKEDYKTEWVLLSIVENTTHDFILTSINNPPNAPIITGPTNGRIWVEYEYNFSISDPDEDSMHIRLDWEHGTPGKWDGPFPSGSILKFNYSWRKRGTYTIKAQTRDTYGAMSDWGELTITMPRNKAINSPILNFLQSHPNMFPLLQLLIQRLGLQ